MKKIPEYLLLIAFVFGISALVKSKSITVTRSIEDCEYVELTQDEYKYAEANTQIFGDVNNNKRYKKVCKQTKIK